MKAFQKAEAGSPESHCNRVMAILSSQVFCFRAIVKCACFLGWIYHGKSLASFCYHITFLWKNMKKLTSRTSHLNSGENLGFGFQIRGCFNDRFTPKERSTKWLMQRVPEFCSVWCQPQSYTPFLEAPRSGSGRCGQWNCQAFRELKLQYKTLFFGELSSLVFLVFFFLHFLDHWVKIHGRPQQKDRALQMAKSSNRGCTVLKYDILPLPMSQTHGNSKIALKRWCRWATLDGCDSSPLPCLHWNLMPQIHGRTHKTGRQGGPGRSVPPKVQPGTLTSEPASVCILHCYMWLHILKLLTLMLIQHFVLPQIIYLSEKKSTGNAKPNGRF